MATAPSIALVGVEDSGEACPICMNSMDKADVSEPLLCPTNCGYNFCASCVSHLITSSKCGYEKASDGNMAVKVRLQCPQCRGDLSKTIEDTLLLRKAHVSEALQSVPDSELNASELRTKHDFFTQNSVHIRQARARARKIRSQIRKESGIVEKEDEDNNDIPSKNEDLANESEATEKPPPSDPTLYMGLNSAMTEAEQTYVTELMTSGDADKVAQAAQILSGIADMSRMGVTPSMRSSPSKKPSSATPRGAASSSSMRRAQSAHARTVAETRALAMARTKQDVAERKRQMEIERHRKLYPLPSRMPKFVTLDTFDPMSARYACLTFGDDEWDGSIADAFSRVLISRRGEIVKEKAGDDEGVFNVLKAEGNGDGELCIASPKNRVVILSVKGQPGRVGIQKGDVVTHIDGEAFEGRAEDLRRKLKRIWEEGGTDAGATFGMVVNAEASTAEALRLRSLVR